MITSTSLSTTTSTSTTSIVDIRQFYCKKWSILALSLISILAKFIIIITLCLFADDFANEIHQQKSEEISMDEARTFFITITIIIGLIWIFFTTIGLFGALFEHYCFTLTFCFLNIFTLLYYLLKALHQPLYWCIVVVDFMIMIITIMFVLELSRIKKHYEIHFN